MDQLSALFGQQPAPGMSQPSAGGHAPSIGLLQMLISGLAQQRGAQPSPAMRPQPTMGLMAPQAPAGLPAGLPPQLVQRLLMAKMGLASPQATAPQTPQQDGRNQLAAMLPILALMQHGQGQAPPVPQGGPMPPSMAPAPGGMIPQQMISAMLQRAGQGMTPNQHERPQMNIPGSIGLMPGMGIPGNGMTGALSPQQMTALDQGLTNLLLTQGDVQ